MATVTFDTLNYCEKLQKAGVPPGHARAMADANAQAFMEMTDISKLATKQDIEVVRREMAENKYDILKWLVTAMLAQTAVLVAIASFFLK